MKRRARIARAAFDRRRSARRRLHWGLALTAVLIAGAAIALWSAESREAPLSEVEARGRETYRANCASCHGERGEGEPDWRRPRPDGGYPAPPQDGSGHTWHHADALLFEIVKQGGGYAAPPGYPATMRGWGDTLTDTQIVEVLAYIKTMWGPNEREVQERMSEQNPFPRPR